MSVPLNSSMLCQQIMILIEIIYRSYTHNIEKSYAHVIFVR